MLNNTAFGTMKICSRQGSIIRTLFDFLQHEGMLCVHQKYNKSNKIDQLSFKGCRVYFVAFILVLMENPVSKQCKPDQKPHCVMSDLHSKIRVKW